jgi:adenosylhomocysteine nucleosidase
MILVATGLKQELNILQGAGVLVVAGGGDGARLERELEEAAGDVSAVISMGLCGALADGLKPGDWVVASEVSFNPLVPATAQQRRVAAKAGIQAFLQDPPVLPDSPEKNLGPRFRGDERNNIETDPAWSKTLVGALRARSGSMLGSDAMIATADAKRATRAATGAIAVDMESHIAAAVARRHNLPFAVARVVSDAAGRSLPRAAQAGMAADGSMDIGAVLRALAADPRQLPALIRVGAEAGKAFRELRRGRDFLGPGLGRSYVGQLPLNVT